jgi:hypothetical protein
LHEVCVPELVHDCGKKVRFPSGTEGKKGRCPHCQGLIEVPGGGEELKQHTIKLSPPPHWKEYEAYLNGGPPPRPLVMPQRLMLQVDADERWDRQAQKIQSKFHCPACRERVWIDQVICTKCGVDFRTGLVLGKNAKLNEKGMRYLQDIPWLAEARKQLRAATAQESIKAPKKKSKTSRIKGKAPKSRKRFR